MKKHYALLFSLALLSAGFCEEDSLVASNPLLNTSLVAAAPTDYSSGPKKEGCASYLRPSNFSIRHDTGRGIGYSKSYSSASFFLAPSIDRFIPFLDLRGHVFDNGKFAANGGLGGRWMFPSSCIAVGGNIFYDYRDGPHHSYHQAGAGIEVIAPWWDCHINAYHPFGAKNHLRKSSGTVFSCMAPFEQITTFKEKSEFSMYGIEAQAGFMLVNEDNFTVHFSAGPYYFWQFNKNAAGGQFKIEGQWLDYISLGVSVSIDTYFQTRTPWFASLSIPFGPKKPKNRPCQSTLCASPRVMNPKLVQEVDRFEIIVVGKKHKEEKIKEPVVLVPN